MEIFRCHLPPVSCILVPEAAVRFGRQQFLRADVLLMGAVPVLGPGLGYMVPTLSNRVREGVYVTGP